MGECYQQGQQGGIVESTLSHTGRLVVAEIINMDRKRPLSKELEAAIRKRRKVLAVQQIFSCSQRLSRCEKCGTQMESNESGGGQRFHPRVPYRFCPSCSEEYIDYIERLKGRGDADCYWRNTDWLESWRRWIDYQGALDRFVRSKEFAKLLKELQETTP